MFTYVSYMIQILDASSMCFYSWIPGENIMKRKHYYRETK